MKNIESKILSEANVETLAMSIYKESKDMFFKSAGIVFGELILSVSTDS